MVTPDDSLSLQLLKLHSSELALENWMTEAKKCFKKHKISLEEYLETVRQLSDQQFLNIANKRKIMAHVK